MTQTAPKIWVIRTTYAPEFWQPPRLSHPYSVYAYLYTYLMTAASTNAWERDCIYPSDSLTRTLSALLMMQAKLAPLQLSALANDELRELAQLHLCFEVRGRDILSWRGTHPVDDFVRELKTIPSRFPNDATRAATLRWHTFCEIQQVLAARHCISRDVFREWHKRLRAYAAVREQTEIDSRVTERLREMRLRDESKKSDKARVEDVRADLLQTDPALRRGVQHKGSPWQLLHEFCPNLLPTQQPSSQKEWLALIKKALKKMHTDKHVNNSERDQIRCEEIFKMFLAEKERIEQEGVNPPPSPPQPSASPPPQPRPPPPPLREYSARLAFRQQMRGHLRRQQGSAQRTRLLTLLVLHCTDAEQNCVRDLSEIMQIGGSVHATEYIKAKIATSEYMRTHYDRYSAALCKVYEFLVLHTHDLEGWRDLSTHTIAAVEGECPAMFYLTQLSLLVPGAPMTHLGGLRLIAPYRGAIGLDAPWFQTQASITRDLERQSKIAAVNWARNPDYADRHGHQNPTTRCDLYCVGNPPKEWRNHFMPGDRRLEWRTRIVTPEGVELGHSDMNGNAKIPRLHQDDYASTGEVHDFQAAMCGQHWQSLRGQRDLRAGDWYSESHQLAGWSRYGPRETLREWVCENGRCEYSQRGYRLHGRLFGCTSCGTRRPYPNIQACHLWSEQYYKQFARD